MGVELVLLSRVAYRDREISGARLRGLLALLARDLRAGSGTARLIDALWPDERPENPSKALQILVSRARSQVGSDLIVRTPTGYRLTLPAEHVDASAVLLADSASSRHARAGDHAAASAEAEAGLALWDGAPAGESDLHDPLDALRAERAATYRSLARTRALSLARLGRHAEAVRALTDLARERPRDEEVLLELLRGEAATAGPAAALARYEAYRRQLRDGLGTEPGPALQAEHQLLLRAGAPAVRQGVEYEPNALLGRDGDLAAVGGMLGTARVVSIVGPGGLGKTRLAQAVSRRAEHRTVHFVPLAGVRADEEVAGEVASALAVSESRSPSGRLSAPRDALGGIVDALGPGQALLVLDNCEQVLGGVADLVRALVSRTSDLRVLTTSRAPLGLSSESVYLLPELDLPTSVELFGQRARAARPGVELPPGVVEELCGRLDGLPLAVELAAARVRVMSVVDIARRLEDRFTLLRGGLRDAPERHHTLQAVVDWSWNLLGPDGQAAMRALSVFPDGFTVDAARWLVQDEAVVEHLVGQSLLKVTDTASGARFRMLETVREFSIAERQTAGETGAVIDRFLAWARDFGMAYREAPFGPKPAQALDRIRAEQDNLLHAMRYGISREDGAVVAAAAAVLGALWTIDSSYTRMSALTGEPARVLSHYRPPPEFVEATRAAAALIAGYEFTLQNPHAVRSLVVLRRLPPAPPDTPLRAVAAILRATPELDADAVVELSSSGEPLLAGVASAVATYLCEDTGDVAGALEAAARMLAVFEHQDSPYLRIVARARLAELYMHVGDGARALSQFRAAWDEKDQLGNWPDMLGLRWAMVGASMQVGALDDAERWLELAGADYADDMYTYRTFEAAVRGELLLARGEIEAGLLRWRRAVQLLVNDRLPGMRVEPGQEPWSLEIKAVAVIAHARHARLDLMEEVAGELPPMLTAMLRDPGRGQVAFVTGLPLSGVLLLAVGMVDLARAEEKGDGRAARSGARLVALAERFGYLRQFHPTMSAALARAAAEKADRPAYVEAVSSYAGLSLVDLRAAALAALADRP